MKALNKDAQNLRTIYSENDVDRLENEILSGGEGSGSGSDSGSGSGSAWSGGLLPGSVVHTENGFASYEFRISWSGGTFGSDVPPSVSVACCRLGAQSDSGIPLSASWSAPYTVRFQAPSISPEYIYYSVPSEYRK